MSGFLNRSTKIIGNFSKLQFGKEETAVPPPTIEATGTTGVLLLALGHPYYGEMAANLAMSLKFSGSPPIHLVYHGNALNHLSPKKRALFDSISLCPDEAFMKNGNIAYFKAKTWMYELSPFDRTLFLDVDMLWFSHRSVKSFIATIQHADWTIQNREHFDLSNPATEKVQWMWGSIAELRKHFTTGKLYSLHSEVVWFKKTPNNKEYFDFVREMFDNPIIKGNDFAGDIADELAFALACLVCDKHPHESPFLPIYWMKLDSREGTEIARLKQKFYGYSVGGSNINRLEQKKYNLLVKGYAFRTGIQNPFRLQPKRKFLPERKSL